MSVEERSGVSMETEKMAGVSRGRLYIGRTELSDTGNYSCVSDALTEAVLMVVTQDVEAQASQVRSRVGSDDKQASLVRSRMGSGWDTAMVNMAVVTVVAVVMAITV
jgi:hypothetical protein